MNLEKEWLVEDFYAIMTMQEDSRNSHTNARYHASPYSIKEPHQRYKNKQL